MEKKPATNAFAATRRLPTVLALLAGALAGASLVAALTPSKSPSIASPRNSSQANAATIAAEEIHPNPAWSPTEVVSQQMQSLLASRTNAAAIRRCFALASPANRQITGPIDRFAAMVATPPYRPLIDVRSYLVGQPIIQGRYAAVLVSLVTLENQSYVYRFLLSRQAGQGADDCWMTDGVAQLLPAPRRPPATNLGPGV